MALLTSGVDVARTVEEALAVLAILLAVWHGLSLRTQLMSVKELATKLSSVETQLKEQIGGSVQEMRAGVQEIREALPTKRLGQFPAFLPNIVELVENATSSVTVFCDYPAYGSFSDPETFRRYHRALEDKIRKLKKQVTIACLGTENRAIETRRQEVKDDKAWADYKSRRRDVFQKYIEFHDIGTDVDTLTNPEFLDYIINEDNHALEHFFHGATKLDVYTRPTVYFWLIDDDTMIFVIPSATRLDEYGFYTQDSHLIKSLKEVARACSPLFGGPVANGIGAAG